MSPAKLLHTAPVLCLLLLTIATPIVSADAIIEDDTPDPALLFIGKPTTCPIGSCFIYGGPPANEVNAIGTTALTIYANGKASNISMTDPVRLILGIPNVTGDNSLAPLTLTPGLGTGSYAGYKGSFDAGYSATPKDVYHFIGLTSKGDGSQSFANWSAADLAVNGITAANFGIYEYDLDGTGLGTNNNPLTVSFDKEIPFGTFAVAFAISTCPTGSKCPNPYTTPFTQAGLQVTPPPPPPCDRCNPVPEPTSWLLLGTGLLGLAWTYKRNQSN